MQYLGFPRFCICSQEALRYEQLIGQNDMFCLILDFTKTELITGVFAFTIAYMAICKGKAITVIGSSKIHASMSTYIRRAYMLKHGGS